jgi:hypothetical protein
MNSLAQTLSGQGDQKSNAEKHSTVADASPVVDDAMPIPQIPIAQAREWNGQASSSRLPAFRSRMRAMSLSFHESSQASAMRDTLSRASTRRLRHDSLVESRLRI